MFRGKVRRIHFVGIGGIGMSGIAEVLINLGFEVSGSDLKATAVTRRLQSLGARVFDGHDAQNVEKVDVVVVSSAISDTNDEVAHAKKLGIAVIARAEMLAELMRLKYGVAVAGSHGKTTTTSLIATLLSAGGLDPTVVVGGKVNALGTNATLGSGEYLVAEADESDGSFLNLAPTIAVITNIDPEHLDHWTGGIDAIVDAFVGFANKVPFYGSVVVCADHPRVRDMIPRIRRKVTTYGLHAEADVWAEEVRMADGRMQFTVRVGQRELGEISLNMLGNHNVQNALAAIAVAIDLGVDIQTIQSALASFGGIGRRFEKHACKDNILIVDDYAHHPAEIAVTLRTAREAFENKLTVVFQPHRYSRTKDLWSEFVGSFSACDRLIVTDIYPAGESSVSEVSAEKLVDAIQSQGHPSVSYGGTLSAVIEELHTSLEPNDVLVTLGAGDVWQVAETLHQRLKPTASA